MGCQGSRAKGQQFDASTDQECSQSDEYLTADESESDQPAPKAPNYGSSGATGESGNERSVLPAGAESLRADFFKLMNHPGWEVTKVDTEREFEASELRIPTSSFIAVRGKAMLDVSISELHTFFTNEATWEAHMAIADEMFADGRVVESIVPNCFFVVHGHFNFPPLTSDRDAVCELLVEHSVTETWCLARSREHASVPVDSEYVRLHLSCSGYYAREVGNRSELSYIAHVDPMGSLPSFAVNTVIKMQAKNVLRIREGIASTQCK